MNLPPLAEILPHRPPMILLDALTHCDRDDAICEVVLRPDALFVEDGRVCASVFLEYMAQAVAAYAGCVAHRDGAPVQVGYLLGARELNLRVEHALVGDRLAVHTRKVWGNEALGNFRCEVRRDGALLADGLLSVYRGPSPEGSA